MAAQHGPVAGEIKITYPASLPIVARKEEIVAALRAHPVVIVAGETGSGKTTQLPKMCLEAGLGRHGLIGCTQPRRVAALSISRRVAEELGVVWGREVGCKIRFTDQTSSATRIKVMTDGILLAEVHGDPDLRAYQALMMDEAHERSLNIDFLLGHLRRLIPRRPDLKLLITSATIDTEAFARAFGGAPVIEVSGRLYPVEVRYVPLDEEAVETGEVTYVDAAVEAVQNVLPESTNGDVLVFMPGERDIRETRDLLQGRGLSSEIIPLFGRLSRGEQQRVFAPSPRRKIVIATNIAETSLTITGIRYVIDTGLARISRYSPGTRTKRLPIEPISQSSANQRKGRAGRVQEGVCLRLYAEGDFLERPRYTQPEIQCANLAEVILRLKAGRLGEIETFPFLDSPSAQAIRSGYQLLEELGALDVQRELTELGRQLARLPVDPTIGRMILQSRQEHAMTEVLIIAAGLSIQDPRERPLDRRAEASAAHEKFQDPDSDFLTLLNLWHAFCEHWEKLGRQNQMRKFCRAHFLSYNRMREWCDIHDQLEETLQDLGLLRHNRSAADYAAIHRSVLTGLWGHLAQKTGRNLYRAAGNRTVMLFPGSGLFEANAPNPASKPRAPEAEKSRPNPQPAWLVAGEIVETSRLYARCVAAIDVEWILDLGAHLCRYGYSEPHWSAEAGRVLVRERITLNGLEVRDHLVGYGRLKPAEATEIFIRSALVDTEPLAVYPFLEHNRRVRQKVELWLTRLAHHARLDPDQLLYEFYARHLEGISSFAELDRWLRDHHKSRPRLLFLTEAELCQAGGVDYEPLAFPEKVLVKNLPIDLSYAFAPGEDHDGVTAKLSIHVAQQLPPGSLDWVVPGLREELLTALLQALPKALRRQFMPIPHRVKEILADLGAVEGNLGEALSRAIHQRYGIRIDATAWPFAAVPAYLRPRLEVTGQRQKVIYCGRDWPALQERLQQEEIHVEQQAWRRAAERWERYGLTGWSFGDVPEQVPVATEAGIPIVAYPGLLVEGVASARVCDGPAGVWVVFPRKRSDENATERKTRGTEDEDRAAA